MKKEHQTFKQLPIGVYFYFVSAGPSQIRKKVSKKKYIWIQDTILQKFCDALHKEGKQATWEVKRPHLSIVQQIEFTYETTTTDKASI